MMPPNLPLLVLDFSFFLKKRDNINTFEVRSFSKYKPNPTNIFSPNEFIAIEIKNP